MDKNNDPLSEYRLVYRAKDFFESFMKQEKLRQKKPVSFNFILNKFRFTLLEFIEDIIGTKFYISDDQLLPNISLKVKRLAANLIKKKIITKLEKISHTRPDEPKIIEYQSRIPSVLPDISLYSDGSGSFSDMGGGSDLEEEKALLKAIGEAVERLSLCIYREENLVLSSYRKVSGKAVDPLSFVGISEAQRKLDRILRIDNESIFRWVECFSLLNKKKVLIPAQLIYIGYKYHLREPIIREQISTGAAAADSFEEAAYKGACEMVERDAFMVSYFNKLSLPIIDLEAIDDKMFQELLAKFKRYNLELYVVDITTDISIPSMSAVIIDRSGVGPVVHIGNKTSLNIKNAVIGAVYEALHGRLGYRRILPLSDPFKKRMKVLKSDPSQIKTFDDRFLYWASLDMINKLEFFFNGPKKRLSKKKLNKYENVSAKEKLKIVVNLFKDKNIDVYGIDITSPLVREEGIYVAKVVSPQLQPLYLNEGVKHLSGRRLFSEDKLNPLPHPFL